MSFFTTPRARLVTFLCAAAALAAVAIVLALGLTASPDASAAGSGFRMAFDVKAPAGVCDAASEPTTCDLPDGTKFSLSVEVIDPPGSGYFGIQTQIYYGSLQYNPTAFASAEIVWPDALGTGRSPGTPTGTEGLVYHTANTASQNPPVSNHEGNIVQISLSCTASPSTTELALPAYDPVDEPLATSVRVPPNTGVAPKSVGERTLPGLGTVDVADVLEINCLDTLPTYTPTPTGPTATPTPTPVPPEGAADMDLTVKSGGTCDAPAKPTSCDVSVGGTFSLGVAANDRPAEGYIGIQVRLARGALVYTAAPLAIDELVWPDCALPLRSVAPTVSDLTFACATALLPPYPVSTFEGNLLDIALTCPGAAGSHTIDLLPYEVATMSNGAGYKLPDPSGEVVPAADSLTINCVVAPTATPAPPPATPASVGGSGSYPDLPGPTSPSRDWLVALAAGAALLLAGLTGARVMKVALRRR